MLSENQFIFWNCDNFKILSSGPILNINFPVLTVVAISVFEDIH